MVNLEALLHKMVEYFKKCKEYNYLQVPFLISPKIKELLSNV